MGFFLTSDRSNSRPRPAPQGPPRPADARPGSRYYSPDLGRWVNRDPIGRRGGPNAYQYVYGDPCNGVDPIGLYVRVTGFTYFVVEIDKVPFWVNSGDFNQWWTSGRGRGRGYDKGVGGACQVYNANPRVGEPTDDKIFQRAAMAYMKNCLK